MLNFRDVILTSCASRMAMGNCWLQILIVKPCCPFLTVNMEHIYSTTIVLDMCNAYWGVVKVGMWIRTRSSMPLLHRQQQVLKQRPFQYCKRTKTLLVHCLNSWHLHYCTCYTKHDSYLSKCLPKLRVDSSIHWWRGEKHLFCRGS